MMYGMRTSAAVRCCAFALRLLPDGDMRWILVSALVELRDFLRYRAWCHLRGDKALSLSSYRVAKNHFKTQPWGAQWNR